MRVDAPPFDMTPQEIIGTLLDPSYEDDGRLIWDAYGEFYRGFPVENLKPLLTSSLDIVLSRGVFLANELGWRVSALAPELAQLMDHSNSGIRFDAIGALTYCTTSDDGEILGKLLQHVEDPDKGVRWRMTQFIRVARRPQLRAAIRYAALQRPNTIYTEIEETFRGSFVVTAEHLQKMIEHPHEGVRLFATGIALRPRKIIDEKFAEIVLEAGDPELSGLVSQAFRMHAIPIDSVFGRVESVSVKRSLH
jgi:hypothetical protein